MSRGVEVVECRTIGRDGQHLRLKLRDSQDEGGRVTWPAIAFGLGEAKVREGQRLDIVYSLAADRGGDPSTGRAYRQAGSGQALELRVKDICPTASGQKGGSE